MALKYNIGELFAKEQELTKTSKSSDKLAEDAVCFWDKYDEEFVKNYENTTWNDALKLIRRPSDGLNESQDDINKKTDDLKTLLKKVTNIFSQSQRYSAMKKRS